MIVVVIIIIIIIALKGTIRTSLQSPHCAVNCFQHVHSSGLGTIVCKSCAKHQALIMCNMSWYKGTVQLLSLTELNRINFSFFYRLKPLINLGREENGVPRENP